MTAECSSKEGTMTESIGILFATSIAHSTKMLAMKVLVRRVVSLKARFENEFK
jgi:hypothetical protein